MNYLDDHKARLAEVQDDVSHIRRAVPDEGARHLEGYMLGFHDAEDQINDWLKDYPHLQEARKHLAQSRKMSFIESITNSFVGFWISVVLAMWTVPWLYGAPAPMKQNIISTVLFTIVSIVRSFVMRRLFTWLHHVKGIN